MRRSAVLILLSFLLTAFLPACTLVGSRSPAGSGPSPREPRGTSDSPNPSPAPSLSPTLRSPPYENPIDYPDAARVAEAIVKTALEAIGTPYRWGGTGANGFDCSGLIQFAYGEFGIDLPRVSRDQLRMGSPVEPSLEYLQPGDVLGFREGVGGEITHVGLHVGEGRFIHSSTSGVLVSDLREPYWQEHLAAARRIVR